MRTNGLVLAFVLSFSLMASAKNGILPTKFSHLLGAPSVSANPAAEHLNYYGGPVISNVKVYVVYWGPNVVQGTKDGIGGFYQAVTKSSYMDWLTEYKTNITGVNGHGGTNQDIGRGSFGGSFTITPNNTNATISDDEIQAELQKQIDAGKLPAADADTLYMTYFPPGVTISAFGATSCKDFCAYHGFKGDSAAAHFYYGVMPDLGGACAWGCGFASTPFDSLTSISSHEMIEAVTDPFPTPGTNPGYPQAWNDVQGNEIADICVNGGTNALTTAGGKTYAVQSEWDNTANSCTSSGWTSAEQ